MRVCAEQTAQITVKSYVSYSLSPHITLFIDKKHTDFKTELSAICPPSQSQPASSPSISLQLYVTSDHRLHYPQDFFPSPSSKPNGFPSSIVQRFPISCPFFLHCTIALNGGCFVMAKMYCVTDKNKLTFVILRIFVKSLPRLSNL